MSWTQVDPPYEFFQLVMWEDDSNPDIKVVVERQAGPDVRDWELKIVDDTGNSVETDTIDTFTNEEDARQAGEEFVNNDGS